MDDSDTDALQFDSLFDLSGDLSGDLDPPEETIAVARPDSRIGAVYCMPDALHLAIEVALTTGRPLLLRGDPGTGKSSVAAFVARRLGWRYYEYVVTSTSTASSLQWHFDAVRRLADAQVSESLKHESEYISPGVLWWALNRESAIRFGREPDREINKNRDPHRAVVLVDEIDKAHPDLPNGLLVALGSNQLDVPYLGDPIQPAEGVKAIKGLKRGIVVAPVQVIVTTNEERELPAAFVRRCITFRLKHPTVERLVEIARAHFNRPRDKFRPGDEKLARAIAQKVDTLRQEAQSGEHRPSTAEFLDAFRACRKRRIKPDNEDPRWRLIEEISLAKPTPESQS